MDEREMRAQALHAALKCVELFVPVAARTPLKVKDYIMLCYNWINTAALGDKTTPPMTIEEPLGTVRRSADPSEFTANTTGG